MPSDNSFDPGLSIASDDEAIALLVSRIKAQRLHRNWPQSELARQAGISRAAYQNFENRVGTLNLRHLVKVLSVLGCRSQFAQVVPLPRSIPVKVVEVPVRLRAYSPRKRSVRKQSPSDAEFCD